MQFLLPFYALDEISRGISPIQELRLLIKLRETTPKKIGNIQQSPINDIIMMLPGGKWKSAVEKLDSESPVVGPRLLFSTRWCVDQPVCHGNPFSSGLNLCHCSFQLKRKVVFTWMKRSKGGNWASFSPFEGKRKGMKDWMARWNKCNLIRRRIIISTWNAYQFKLK